MRNNYFALVALALLPALAAAQTTVPADVILNAYANQTLTEATNSIELRAGFSASPTAGFTARLVPDPAIRGQWSANSLWTPERPSATNPLGGMIAVHTHVLPDGRVLSWSGHNDNAHYYTNGMQPLSHAYAWSPDPAASRYPRLR